MRTRVIGVLLMGCACAQEAGKNRPVQKTTEQVSPPQASRQLESTKGSPTVNNFNIFNGDYYGPMPHGPALPADVRLLNAATQPAPMAEANGIAAAQVAMTRGRATHQLIFGGMSPPTTNGDNTGTATQTPTQTNAAGAQSPNQNWPLSPVQDVKPNVNPSLAFGMPGSAVSSTASGTQCNGSGPTTGAPQTNSPMQAPTYTNLRVPSQYVQSVLEYLKSAFGATAQPATKPLTTEPTP